MNTKWFKKDYLVVPKTSTYLRIIAPAIASIGLFVIVLYFIFIPFLQNIILKYKREMIRELTVSACEILEECHRQEFMGDVSREEAQEKAIALIKALRYGPEMKDYFWINDMHHRIVMHPYRTDMEKQDISDYIDPTGNLLYVDFSQVVRENGEGYIDYIWQWKDKSNRNVQTISFVKKFAPWGWIIGTGLYIEDIRQEVSSVRQTVVGISTGIFCLVSLLSFYTMRLGIRAETARRESEERYRLLVETSSSGIFIYRGNQYIYVNPSMELLTGYTRKELLGMNSWDLVHPDFRDHIRKLGQARLSGVPIPTRYETAIQTKNGEKRWVDLIACQIEYEGQPAGLVSFYDTTERKLTEDKLRKSEAKYRELIEHANSIILRMDRKGCVIFFNEFAQEFFGYSEEEIIGRNVIGTILPETDMSEKEYQAMILDIGQHPEQYTSNENENIRRNGERVWISWTNRVIFDKTGNVTEILCVGNDITKRKKAEEELSAEREKLFILLSHIVEGITAMDEDYNILFMGGQLVEEFGDQTGKKCYSAFCGMEKPCRENCAVDEIIKSGKEDFQYFLDTKMDLENGLIRNEIADQNNHRIAEKIARPFYHKGRRCVIEISMDITKRKRAEEALQRSLEQYRALTEESPDVIMRYDKDYRHLYVNPAIKHYVDLCPKDIIGKTIREIGYSHNLCDFWEKCVQKVFETGIPLNEVFEIEGRNGLLVVDWRLVPEFDVAGNVETVMGTSRDITAIKRAERENAELEKQLYAAQKLEAIAQLAGGVAHNFNNLLTAIMGNIYFARMSGPVEIQNNLLAANAAAERAAQLVQQLLAHGRKSSPQQKSINVNEIVAEVRSLIWETIDRRIDIVINTEKNLPSIQADPSQINSVLMNLCLNARDAIAEVIEGLTESERCDDRFVIEIRTETVVVDKMYCTNHSCAWPGHFVMIRVSDNGTGMTQEIQQHVFEPFYTTKKIGKGTGLGLASAYEIIKQHGGWIDLYSESGKGTTFKIYLPAQKTTVQDGVTNGTYDIAGGSETILIVDDEASLLELGQEMMCKYGYFVMTAADGKEALDVYSQKRDHIDLVILDLSMPHLSGIEVLEGIRRMDKEVKVIVNSGYMEETVNGSLRKLRPDAYIRKPYSLDDLVRTVRIVLDGANVNGTEKARLAAFEK